MEKSYEYPLLPEWTTDELISVINFYVAVENLYEKGTKRAEFIDKYQKFCQIVPAKMTQKQLDKEFERVSKLSIYRAVKYVQAQSNDFVVYRED